MVSTDRRPLWCPGHAPVFNIGAEYSISFAFDNIGNGTAERAIVNIMLRDFVEIYFRMSPAQVQRGVISGDASVWPAAQVFRHVLAASLIPIHAGFTSMFEFKLRVQRDPTPTRTGDYPSSRLRRGPSLERQGTPVAKGVDRAYR